MSNVAEGTMVKRGHATAIEQKAEKLKPRHLRFLQNYFSNGFNATKAYENAGFQVKNSDIAAVNASKLLRNAKVNEILELIKEEGAVILKGLVPKAALQLGKVLDDPKQKGGTKIAAAREVLDRAGLIPPPEAKPDQSFNIQINIVEKKRNRDIRASQVPTGGIKGV